MKFRYLVLFVCLTGSIYTSRAETLKGTIIKEQFRNKGGKYISDVYDLFLKTNKSSYFIKRCSDESNAQRYVSCKVEVEASITDGLWDACTDEMVQSRTGQYIEIKKLRLIKDPMTYSLLDRANNKYSFSQEKADYDPMTPEESSSGTYSGGTKKSCSLTLESFTSLRDLFYVVTEDKSKHTDQRRMMTYSITYQTEKERTSFVVENSPRISELEEALIAILWPKE